MSSLLKKLEKSGVKVVGYAADIAILVQGKFHNTLSELLSQGLRIVKKRTIKNGRNESPTEIVMFMRIHRIQFFKGPNLNRIV